MASSSFLKNEIYWKIKACLKEAFFIKNLSAIVSLGVQKVRVSPHILGQAYF